MASNQEEKSNAGKTAFSTSETAREFPGKKEVNNNQEEDDSRQSTKVGIKKELLSY